VEAWRDQLYLEFACCQEFDLRVEIWVEFLLVVLVSLKDVRVFSFSYGVNWMLEVFCFRGLFSTCFVLGTRGWLGVRLLYPYELFWVISFSFS
jgi:hypothetical protein